MVARNEGKIQGTDDDSRSVVDSLPPQAFHAIQMLVERGSPTIWTDLEGALDTMDDRGSGCLLLFNGQQVIVPQKVTAPIDSAVASGVRGGNPY
jgi:hypothetical protein